jgi:hypothetical protein
MSFPLATADAGRVIASRLVHSLRLRPSQDACAERLNTGLARMGRAVAAMDGRWTSRTTVRRSSQSKLARAKAPTRASTLSPGVVLLPQVCVPTSIAAISLPSASLALFLRGRRT